MSNLTHHISIRDADHGLNINIDFQQIKKAAIILRALNHTLRQQILKLLDQGRKSTVTEIYVKLRLEQSVTSQHLAILRRANLVKTHREGKFVFYSINYPRINNINNIVKQVLESNNG